MDPVFKVNVGKYTIHGSCGYDPVTNSPWIYHLHLPDLPSFAWPLVGLELKHPHPTSRHGIWKLTWMAILFTKKMNVHPWKPTWQYGHPTIWRWIISFSKWCFSVVMLVFRGVFLPAELWAPSQGRERSNKNHRFLKTNKTKWTPQFDQHIWNLNLPLEKNKSTQKLTHHAFYIQVNKLLLKHH